jgi:cytochrome c oxidase subunit III
MALENVETPGKSKMAGTDTVQEIELIIEDIGGGGGGVGRPPGGGDDGGSDDSSQRRKQPSPSPRRYSTGMALALVSILMFFMALASTFLVLRGGSDQWVPVRLPRILWINTIILLASSATLEVARRRLGHSDLPGFRKFWRVTTLLGVLFLLGQVVAWRQLVSQGVYVASSQASSFFYIFTAAHGLHLLGGVAALAYVALRKFEDAKVSRSTAAEVASYYWHFMDALWVFLLALLSIGK